MIGRVIGRAWRESPRETWRRVARRLAPGLPVADGPPPWRSGKHQKWNRLPYYLDLFAQMAKRHGRTFDVVGKHVLEIGGGPVLGLGPLVLAQGARAFTLVEPGWVEVRHDDDFRRSYLGELWQMHAPLFAAPGLDERAFLARIDAARVVAEGMETYAGADPVDVFVSKSCLEHVPDLATAIAACARASAPGAIHAHYVDFSLHRVVRYPESPFGNLYGGARATHSEAIGQPNGHLNLLRPSEMLTMFRRHLREVQFQPLIQVPVATEGRHADWRSFDAADLGVVNGIILGVA